MSRNFSDENMTQVPGDAEPQAPRSVPVAQVDDGNHPLNHENRSKQSVDMTSEPMQK